MAYKDNLTVTEQLKELAATQSIDNIDIGRITAYSRTRKIYTIQLLSGAYVQAVALDEESYSVNSTVEVTRTKGIKGVVSILRVSPISVSSNPKTYLV